MFLPLTVTLVSAPGLAVFLVARSSFFTWATAGIKPLNKRALNRIRFISDVVPFSREYTTRAATAPAGFTSETSLLNSPGLFLDFSWVTGYLEVIPVNPNAPLLPACRPSARHLYLDRRTGPSL